MGPSETLQRAAWLLRPGQVEVRSTPVPRPAAGEVLLRIDRALVGGTDRKAYLRGHPQIPMPGPFGHRYAGTVAAVGRAAPPFEVGQPVMGVHSAPCLECSLCRKGRPHLCPHVMREKVLGAFGQYLCVPAAVARQNLFGRPAQLPADHAALLEPVACVVHALERIDWRGVDRVLVLGLGVMGLLFAQLLPRYTNAARAGAGRRADRLTLARRFGLDPVVDLRDPSAGDGWPGDDLFDCVIECTGALDGWQAAVRLSAPGGQALLFGGLPRDAVFPADSYRLHYEEVRLLGSFHFGPADVRTAREHLLAGAIDAVPLLTGTLPLDGVGAALERLKDGVGLQYAIDPWA